jgi:hypothetical protein
VLKGEEKTFKGAESVIRQRAYGVKSGDETTINAASLHLWLDTNFRNAAELNRGKQSL